MDRRSSLKRKTKQWVSIVLCLFIVSGYIPTARAASAQETGQAGQDDLTGHWAENEIRDWNGKGLIAGFEDGTYRPNQSVTRAQFAKLVNSLFGFKAQSAENVLFADVAGSAWYTETISIAKQAGYIKGYPDGSFQPGAAVTRQEAATMAASLFHLQAASDSSLDRFKDVGRIGAFAKGALDSMVSGGYLKGFADDTIRPTQAMSRAEAVVLLDRLAGEVLNKSGKREGLNEPGNLMITTTGVELGKSKIERDLLLTAGIGEGDAKLSDVSVTGTAYINGGGVHSIYFNDSKLGGMEVNKPGSPVRIVFSSTDSTGQLNVETEAIIVMDEGSKIGQLIIGPNASGTMITTSGSIGSLTVSAKGVTLNGQPVEPGTLLEIVDGRIKTTTPVDTTGNGTGNGNTGGNTGGGNPGNTGENPSESEWQLAWSDEFDRSGSNLDTNGVDLDKWAYQEGTGAQYGLDGWGNNEKEYYRKDNIKVQDGKLIIEARKGDFGGKAYTSGRLYTQPTFNKTFGKFEAKIKMPAGEGIWPAFWMMPKDSEYGVWASSGELDILEARGRLPQEVAGTIHYGKSWPNNKSTGGSYDFPAGEDITGEHVYGVEWEPGEIRWYVDGHLFQKLNNWDSTGDNMPAKYAYPAPFDKPFYMILNLAIGGDFDGGGMPTDNMLPAQMIVDYVRVYDKVGGYNTTPAEPQVQKETIQEPYKHAENGSFVYDPQYAHGFKTINTDSDVLDASYWNFVKLASFSGNAAVSTEQLSGTPFAKVDITEGGSAVHAVQLIQNVTLGKGRWYKLSFDAKSSGNRTMVVKFGGGADRGWGTYSDTLEAALTDQLQSYQLTFRMDANTDPLARLEFNMGLNTKPVWLGNVKLVEIDEVDPYHEDASKEPIGGNHVYNGTFDLGHVDRMTYWHFKAGSGASATASVNADRQFVASITNGGASAEAVKLSQKGISFVEGNDYELTFKAKASKDRSIAIGASESDGTPFITPVATALTSAWTTYTVHFSTGAGSTDPEGQLLLLLGGDNGNVTIDDVKLVRLTNNNVGELPLADQFPLKNGDFSNGKTSWSEHVQGRYDGWGSSADFSVTPQDEMKISIANEGVNPWDVMLMQTDFSLHKDNVYVVSADIRSTVPRAAEIVVDAGGQRYVSEKVNLTAQTQRFSYELPVDTDLTASYKLLLGKLEGEATLTAHEVYVDNVRVELKNARSRAFLIQNGDFAAGSSGWNTHLQGDYDGDSSASVSFDNGSYHAEIGNDGANPWDVMLIQEPLQLVKGKTYVATFTARSTKPRTIDVSVENSSYFRYLNQTVQLDDTTNTYSYEFTVDKDDTAGLKFLMGKPSGAAAVGAHDVWIDNVRIDVKGALEATGEQVSSRDDIHLTAPPALSPDAADNVLGQPITITFADQAAWRSAITSVSVDGYVADTGLYTVANGSIMLDDSLFGEERDYEIVVKAAGYEKAAVTQRIDKPSDWSIVWQDEFDGSGTNLDTNGINLDKWAYQLGTGSQYGLDGWGNNEQQYYRSDNMTVEDGNLVITAKNDGYGGKPYTSGRVYTQPTFTQAYGRFEARMQLPTGDGIWPAFWMMPAGSDYGTWASSGELDIMEARGRLPEEVAGTIHYGKAAPNNKSTGATYDFPSGESIAGYHTYAVEWEPGEIRWYVDGNLFQTANNWESTGAGQPDKYAYPAPFDKPFYMILNLAVGGAFDGNRLPDASKIPATMKVDYVRVYDLTGRPYRTPTEPVIEKEPFPSNGKAPIDGNLLYDKVYAHGLTDVAASGTPLDPTYWSFLHTPDFGGAASAAIDTIGGVPYAKASITNGGNQSYAIQMIQYATLTRGHTYKVSFDAKASANRAMSMKFGGDDDNGWATYSDSFDIPLKTDMQHYEYRFTMNAETDIAARLEFNMGLSTGSIWIGNVVLEETDVLSDPNGSKEPLADGNHVYNGTFDLGTMDRMKYWSLQTKSGAAATASVDSNRRQLEIGITSGGSAANAVTLEQQGLQLLQTDDYKLTFDAKSSSARTIGVRFVSADGTVVYAEQANLPLGTALTSQTFTFTMPQGASVSDGRLVFLLGVSDDDVTLDNVKLVRLTNRNVDFTGIELFPLKNGDFSAGLTAWEPFTQGGAAIFQSEDGAAKISVTNPGSESWNVMFNQSNLMLSKGVTYVVSFRAKSSVPRDIEATLENASYTRRFDTGSIGLTTDWQTFQYSFKMTADESVALKFILGKLGNVPAGAHDIYIDDVVVEIQNAPVQRPPMLIADGVDNRVGQPIQLTFMPDAAWEAAVQSITVNGTTLNEAQYTVQSGVIELGAGIFAQDQTYAVAVKADGYADTAVSQTVYAENGSIVLNGSFSSGDTGWDTWVGESGVSTFAALNGTAKVDIAYHGGIHPEWNVPVSWSTQLFQSGIELEAGKSYELSFRAWSTADRPILIELGGYNNNQQAEFNLTADSSSTYTTSLRVSANTTLTLKYLLGNVVTSDGSTPNVPHTIYIDDVIIREVKSAPVLQADVTDNKIGRNFDMTFAEDAVWRSSIVSVTIDGVTVPSGEVTFDAGVIHLDASLFPVVKSYSILIQASGYAAASAMQEVKSAASNVALGKSATASTFGQPAANAFDGAGGSRWEWEAADPQWIAVDLGKQHLLDTVVLNWEGAFAKTYRIQVSTVDVPQDSDWTDVYSESNGNGGLDTIAMNGVEARHVRMYGTSRGTPYGYSLWEFEVYGTPVGGSSDPDPDNGGNPDLGNGGTTDPDNGGDPGTGGGQPSPGTNLALHASVTASSASGSASLLTDGILTNRWEADWAANNSATPSPEWVVIDLADSKSLTSLKLYWERAYASKLLVQVSGNGTDWTTVQSLDRALTIDVGQTYEETVDLSGYTGRYIRVFMTDKGFPPYGPSLYEIEVY